ncbi:MAG: hypothetical protein ABR570_12960 [Burkholderiales bacterium]
MKSGFVVRAKAAWTFGLVVVLVGFVPVLLFVGQSLAGISLLPDGLPQFPNAWLEALAARLSLAQRIWMPRTLPPGLALAVAGLLAMMLGAVIARRQAAVLEAEKRETEDRLRRVRQYELGGHADGRIDPYIGSPLGIDEVEPKESFRFVNADRSPLPDNARSRERAVSW